MYPLAPLIVVFAASTLPFGPHPRAILDKAIEAHGGAANLKRFQALKVTGKGKLHSGDRVIPYDGEFACQWPDRTWFSIKFETQQRKYHLVGAINGVRGWSTANGIKERDIDAEIAEEREMLHADWIGSLRAMLDHPIPIAYAGEARIEGQAAVGITVSDEGHRPVKLFFDKKSGLLLKSEAQAKDPESHQEYAYEEIYSDYRTVQGLKFAMRTKVLKKGKLYSERERMQVTPLEKLDERLFAES